MIFYNEYDYQANYLYSNHRLIDDHLIRSQFKLINFIIIN